MLILQLSKFLNGWLKVIQIVEFVSLRMGISEEIEVTTIPIDETTILEIKATITSVFRLNLTALGRSFHEPTSSPSQLRATRQARANVESSPFNFFFSVSWAQKSN